jgi:hypothetical protein
VERADPIEFSTLAWEYVLAHERNGAHVSMLFLNYDRIVLGYGADA